MGYIESSNTMINMLFKDQIIGYNRAKLKNGFIDILNSCSQQ
jgi:hypothetical protein